MPQIKVMPRALPGPEVYAQYIEDPKRSGFGIGGCTLAEIPLHVLLPVARAVGVEDELCRALRLNLVESNGCVSFLHDGRLLCSLPSAEYRERLAMAGKVKIQAHRKNCPEWTAEDAAWVADQWQTMGTPDARPAGPRPSPPAGRCNCGAQL